MKDQRKSLLRESNVDWLAGRISAASGPTVLVADDSEADIFFLLRAFSASKVSNPIYVVRSGAEVIQYLAGEGRYADRARFPVPKIIFLDLQMPTIDGLEVLHWKKHRTEFDSVLWIAMSNFDSVKTINEAYSAGATTFLSKPLDAADVRNLIEAFNDHWQLSAHDRSRNDASAFGLAISAKMSTPRDPVSAGQRA